jgi:hypothetical protein
MVTSHFPYKKYANSKVVTVKSEYPCISEESKDTLSSVFVSHKAGKA